MAGQLVNKSRFLIPYSFETGCESLNKGGWSENGGKKEYLKDILGEGFSKGWEEKDTETRYLADYIDKYLNGSEKICHHYYLGIGKEIHMVSSIRHAEEKYEFILDSIELYQLVSGSGCLVYNVIHGPEEDLPTITDKCHAISRIFEREHDNGKQENELTFSYSMGEETKPFSLKNLTFDILRADENEDLLIFRSKFETRCAAYHQLLFESEDSFEKDRPVLRNLARGLTSDAYDSGGDSSEIYSEYSVIRHSHWEICSTGAVVATYAAKNEANRGFLKKYHRENIDKWYFTLFLIDYEEREMLLYYNSKVAENWKDVKALEEIRKKIIDFNLWFGYGTVSVESTYQCFHEQLRHVFRLDKLENEITDMIEKVKEYEEDAKNRRTDGILTVLSILAITSVLIDGVDFIERLYAHDMNGGLYYGFFVLVAVAIIYTFIKVTRK